jgi:hypothetical protein
MELDTQSLFGLLCTAVYSLAETAQLPPPPAFGLIYEGAGYYPIRKGDEVEPQGAAPPPLNLGTEKAYRNNLNK